MATKRRRTPLLLAGLAAVAGLVAGVWWLTHRGRENTDDAQVEGRVIAVSPRVTGQAIHVKVLDNQHVEAGDVLVELDPADYAAKVDGAKADLAAAKAAARAARATLDLTKRTAPASIVQAQGNVTAASSTTTAARATLEQRRAAVTAAEARRTLAKIELDRTAKLTDARAIPIADLDQRKAAFDTSEADVAAAQADLRAATATIDSAAGQIQAAQGRLSAAQTEAQQVESAEAAVALADARVEQTTAALKTAELNLSYTTIRAAHRGTISRRSVEEGQFVDPSRPVLAIVPEDDVWIVANFKEDQLGEMAVGNPATIELDTFSGTKLHGHVESIAGGTGARFALLPPDNATGNFVKVVQRVPVLIRLDAKPTISLRPGMSADVTVDTREVDAAHTSTASR
ncbi:MAG: HlyD family secretion protein [Kofleriaceae bacterium]